MPHFTEKGQYLRRLVSQTLGIAAFTDNVEAGTITLAPESLAAGEAGTEDVVFTVTSTATVRVGISGDTDKYSANTAQSVAAAGSVGALALAVDAMTGFSAAKTPRVTVVEGSNFGALDTGSMVVTIYYLDARG